MTSRRAKTPLSLEVLEDRLALSTIQAAVTSPAGGPPVPPVAAVLPTPTNPTLAGLVAFANAYQSHPGEAERDPRIDLNHNNQIAQVDGKLLLHALPPLSPNVPLKLTVEVEPSENVTVPHSTNSGGTTYDKLVTVVGHTTPGALIFTGSGTLDLKLRGPATVADDNGFFEFKVNLTNGINQFDLQAVDAYGHQTLRAFPILWLGFGKYEAQHPKND